MELGPDAGTRSPSQQTYRFAAVAEGQNKQSCPAILAGLGIAHHRTTAVVDLRLFSWCGQDNARGFRMLRSEKRPNKALHRLIAACKAVVGHQVLPNRLAIAASCQALFDQLAVRFTDTCRWRGRITRSARFL